MDRFIKIRGARENNLKGIDLDIPRDELTVLTGLSGSGKSSLAFDTIYAEGQRRYMESVSSYARQFLGQMEKPDVDQLEGLPPAISIDQKTTNRNPRSTVGTVTEIYDYLRLLYARIGIPHCPKCGREIHRQTVDEIVDKVMALPEKTKVVIWAPVVRGKKGEHEKVFQSARKSGYVVARVDGAEYQLSEDILLDKNVKHQIAIRIDRLVVKDGIQSRMAQSVENAFDLAEHLVIIENMTEGQETMYSAEFSCPDCDISIEEVEPRSFSFNNPFGACPDCGGLGFRQDFDMDLLIPDNTKSIHEGLVACSGWGGAQKSSSWLHAILKALADQYGESLDTPFNKTSEKFQDVFINGQPEGEKIHFNYKTYHGQGQYFEHYEGVLPTTRQRYRECFSANQREEYERYMRVTPCETCHGMRLKPGVLAVTIQGKNIHEFTNQPVRDMLAEIDGWTLTETEKVISRDILKEVHARLTFLRDVGLDYLTLTRQASTLSGGEAQRIRLATQIGSGLVGVAYILDEPSIGLHQKDNTMLIRTLKHLRDTGNTVIVVEHDEETMREADYLVDIGPGAGEHGGKVVAAGTVQDIIDCPESITGQYLSGKLSIPVPKKRRTPTGWLEIVGATENNLKNIDVKVPLGVFTCVTGVSGSGKSSLIDEILTKNLDKTLNRALVIPGKCKEIRGTENLDKIISIDQSPIGRQPRSNPATYTGLMDLIRDLFTETQEAKIRGYKNGRFSFNVPGGRCEACKGDGIKKIEMHFLPDIYVPCEVCGGARYNKETLECLYKGKNIADVLHMTVEEAYHFFEHVPKIKRKLETLYNVGLGYIRLGQPATELSGGEAQRVKLASELSKKATGRTVYVLDEPTTGLHFEDVRKLIEILQMLTDGGNTVVVIEHNLDVIKCADYIIDMGPDGGDKGGTVVTQGTPEEVAKCEKGYTGAYIKKYLNNLT